IISTGGGKSLIFILPIYYTSNGVMIIVTPLVALENDINAQYIKIDIDLYI
ncbi:hypothetical protein B0J13DRAFT_449730, partial [Dactylonectria estremocensis]